MVIFTPVFSEVQKSYTRKENTQISHRRMEEVLYLSHNKTLPQQRNSLKKTKKYREEKVFLQQYISVQRVFQDVRTCL